MANDSDKKNAVPKIPKFVFQISDIERQMIDELKNEPYFVNMSGYLRASIRHLHKKKTKQDLVANVAKSTKNIE